MTSAHVAFQAHAVTEELQLTANKVRQIIDLPITPRLIFVGANKAYKKYAHQLRVEKLQWTVNLTKRQ